MKRLLIVAALLFLMPHLLAQEDNKAPTCPEINSPTIDVAFYVGMGDVFFREGLFTVAIQNYSCALELDEEYVPAYIKRGYAYVTQRNDPLALADYNRALEIDPESAAAYTHRGMLYTVQGAFVPALADFDLATALDPVFAPAYYNRGIVHAIEGNHDLALADLNTALELDPGFDEVHAAIGAVYLDLAMASYGQYWDNVGRTINPPGGDPEFMLFNLRRTEQTEDFSPWLALQVPAEG